MALREGLERAIDTFLSSAEGGGLIDQVITSRPTLAVLMGAGLEAEKAGLGDVGIKRSNSIAGNEARFSFRTGIPVGRGVRAHTGALNDLDGTYSEATTTVDLTAGPSFYEASEAIRVAEVSRFTSDVSNIGPWLQTKIRATMDGLFNAINADLWPSHNLAPGLAGGAHNGAAEEDRVMAFLHPLQTGAADNVANTATSYSYWGYDIGTNPGSQAINVGTGTATVIPTINLLRSDVLLPLRARGVSTSGLVAPVDALTMNYYADLIEDKIVIANETNTRYGVMSYQLYDGLRVYHEPRLDLLAGSRRVIPILNPDTWNFTYVWPEVDAMNRGTASNPIAVKEVPTTSAFYNMTTLLAVRLICTSPRHNAQIYNVNVAASS